MLYSVPRSYGSMPILNDLLEKNYVTIYMLYIYICILIFYLPKTTAATILQIITMFIVYDYIGVGY